MIQMERLVFDVMLSVIGDEAKHLSLESDFDILDVDQLTITYIVLALESRLGLELPTSLEEARTVAELVAGAQKAEVSGRTLRPTGAESLGLPKLCRRGR